MSCIFWPAPTECRRWFVDNDSGQFVLRASSVSGRAINLGLGRAVAVGRCKMVIFKDTRKVSQLIPFYGIGLFQKIVSRQDWDP